MRPGIGASGWAGGLGDESVREAEQLDRDLPGPVAQVHAVQGGDLVVAGAPRPQPAAQVGADALDQATFQGGVDVLVGDRADELARGDVGLQTVQARQQPGELVLGQQPGAPQHPGVGP